MEGLTGLKCMASTALSRHGKYLQKSHVIRALQLLAPRPATRSGSGEVPAITAMEDDWSLAAARQPGRPCARSCSWGFSTMNVAQKTKVHGT